MLRCSLRGAAEERAKPGEVGADVQTERCCCARDLGVAPVVLLGGGGGDQMWLVAWVSRVFVAQRLK